MEFVKNHGVSFNPDRSKLKNLDSKILKIRLIKKIYSVTAFYVGFFFKGENSLHIQP